MLKLWYSNVAGTTWTLLNAEQTGFCLPKLDVSYQRPARLTFRLHAPQHLPPIPLRAQIVFVDEDYSASFARPVFEGHVTEINPVDANILDYVCDDPTRRAREEITILSGPHADPLSYPRLIYNSKIDNDDDRAYEFRHDVSVGVIVKDILTFAYNELLTNCQAAPPVTIGGDAFLSTDLLAFDFVPQEKMVFESQRLGEGLDRLLAYYPAHRIIFHPGQGAGLRTWRFIHVPSAPAVTMPLNDFRPGRKWVVALDLERSLEDRFTAVKIVGPPQTEIGIVQQEDDSRTSSVEGGLTKLWTVGNEINFKQFGPYGLPEAIGNCARKWQIADPLKRRLARILPSEVMISCSEFNVTGTSLLYKRTRNPTFQVTFDDGKTWWTVNGVTLDLLNGIITAPYPVHQFSEVSSASSGGSPGSLSADQIGNYRPPDNARFIFAYQVEPLSVRAPSTGFAGSAYASAGMQTEMKLYDEMLAVNYETGYSPTALARTTEYAKLAAQILDTRKDVLWRGGCALEGIDYEFLRLNRRVQFSAVDRHGDPLTTGWESIGAILTDVEYDYEENLTTLTFSTERGKFSEENAARLRARLKEKARKTRRVLISRAVPIEGGYTLEFEWRDVVINANAP